MSNPKEVKPQEEAKKESTSSKVKNTKPSHINLDYTGSYNNENTVQHSIYRSHISNYLFAQHKKTFD